MTDAPVKVLVLSRLFSGFVESVTSGVWAPSGAPAVARLLEAMAADPSIDLTTVFLDKDGGADLHHAPERIEPIGPIAVCGAAMGLGRRMGALLTELRHLTFSVLAILRHRPDVIYATYANFRIAGLIARFSRKPVVLRLMGIFPHHRQVAARSSGIEVWLMRSPFAHVICSEDGSDPEGVLSRLLPAETPRRVVLNGVEFATPINPPQDGRTLLHVGRLEPYKGCEDVLAAARDVVHSQPGVRFDFIGDGSLREALEKQAGDGIRFLGAVPRAEVQARMAAAEICVSANLHGNLSNVNLEALAAGTCLVMPTSDPSVPIDTSTDRLLPPDVVLRYDRGSIAPALRDALLFLLDQPAEIARRRAEAAALAGRLLKSWDERMADEIDLIRSCAQRPVGRGGEALTNEALGNGNG